MRSPIIRLIQHWRSQRNLRILQPPYSAGYAFVGVGSHALQNLYPVLQKRLSKDKPISYTLSYHTGAYPEGNPFTELFIHPVDLVSYLFGEAGIKAVRQVDTDGATTVQALVSHGEVTGIMELSTAYSWTTPKESLHINTRKGEYRLEQMERLYHNPHPKRVAGIPLEKLGLFTASEQALIERNNFNPLITNNQLYTQGFLPEIKAFADMVEHSGKNQSPLYCMHNTYKFIASLKP